MRNSSFFVLWPYSACVLLVSGTLIRYFVLSRRRPALAEEVSEAWAIFGGSRLWRLSLVILLVGHLIGLLFPRAVLHWNSVPARLYATEGVLFVAGCFAVVRGGVLVWKHLGRSSPSFFASVLDTVFLAFLMVGLVSGLVIAAGYRWGSSWGAMTLGPYVSSLLRGEPSIDFAAEMPSLARLHVLSAFAAIAMVPFTRLSTLLVALIHGGVTLAARPLAAVGHGVGVWFTKHNPGALFWPEED